MSKLISPALKAHQALETTTLASCLVLEWTTHTPLITAITKADPGQVTTEVVHGLTTGDQVILRDIEGMTEINNVHLIVTVVDTTNYTVGIDTSSYTTFIESGTSNKLLGFTSHDKTIVFDNITFYADFGYTPSSVVNQSDISVDNLEISGLIDSDKLIEDELIAGKYDFARAWLFTVNWFDLSMLEATIKYGRIGEVSLERNIFNAEFRGLTQALDQDTIIHYAPACGAQFGDAKCMVDLSAIEFNGTVTDIIDQRKFWDTSIVGSSNEYTGGVLRWLTGYNAGVSIEIREHLEEDPPTTGDPSISFLESLPFTIQIGDTYIMSPGCGKSLSDCETRYSNALNFRGFPHLPGMAEMLNFGYRTTELVQH